MFNRTLGSRLVGVALLAALLIGSATSVPVLAQPPISASPTPSSCPANWNIVPSPNPSSGDYNLTSVTVISPTDAWAVGAAYAITNTSQPLIMHWDGSSWNIAPSPAPPNALSSLQAVAAAHGQVWAVGYSYVSGTGHSLIENWSTSGWQIVPSPDYPGANYNNLNAVAVLSPDDVWAVGNYVQDENPHTVNTLVEHWDGSVWRIVPSPNPYPNLDNSLQSVVAINSSDVWAVGGSALNSAGAPSATLIEHWDGSSWQIVASPPMPDYTTNLGGVAAAAPGDIWATGSYANIDGSQLHPLALHWDGSSWQAVSSPSFGANQWFGPIAGLGSKDLWTVGKSGSYSSYKLAAWHWDGLSWQMAPFASHGPDPNPLDGLTAVAGSGADDVWAVGSYSITSTNHTLIEHYTQSCTPTPVPCQPPFVDIAGNIFYPAIDGLYCLGTISGNDSTHYAPAATATRAQFARVVTLAFGLTAYTPAGNQDFTDVPPGYYAYPFIESGYHAGILTGFDQAGCATHGAVYPCYLPNLPITRGQLTKLVVSATGLPLITPIFGQSFTDVPPTNPFYLFIETAYGNGVINGYPDQTFRPNQSIRRDEMAGIVYKAVSGWYHANKKPL